MAVVHQKKAGQWGKQKARERWYQTVGTVFTVTLLMGLVPGYVAGRFSWLFAIWAFVVASFVVYGLIRVLEKQTERWSKERLKFLRGAQAEALVAWYLEDLPDAWHVFNNLKSAAGGDVDHVVVGPGGVFVISTKSFKGYVDQAPNGTVRINGRPLSALDQAMTLAMGVRNRLKNTIGDAATPWVQPVLALPLAGVKVPEREGKVWVADENAIVRTIETPTDRPKLTAQRIKRVVEELDRVGASGTEQKPSPVS